jgi:hypothetical protein
MKYVQDIVTIAKNSESNVSANLTTQLPPVNLPSVCENPKAVESNTTNDTNRYITVDNELVESSSKRHKTMRSFTSQTKNTNTAILDHDASCSYTIIPNNLTLNF